ncbi:NUDIX domain-containing protein [Bacillus sp. FJAT-22090]|uniref:NUDIX domain-containing protein n=1 Tax=Bacillus sp. FJAT-22090 TaxID=1581038 RepID=UPI0011A887A5|nr:NUDIX domain-containing protein [Bacillus sp. FJAT-22090]
MISFQDLNGIRVELSFERGAFPIRAMHVLILAKHENKWLLTKHPKRGLEFPGGKVEDNETIEEAAIRETLEETNVEIHHVEWFAEYMVLDIEPFSKVVFVAKVREINENKVNYETEGAVWLTTEELVNSENLSFHMKDAGMQAIIGKADVYEGKWNN